MRGAKKFRWEGSQSPPGESIWTLEEANRGRADVEGRSEQTLEEGAGCRLHIAGRVMGGSSLLDTKQGVGPVFSRTHCGCCGTVEEYICSYHGGNILRKDSYHAIRQAQRTSVLPTPSHPFWPGKEVYLSSHRRKVTEFGQQRYKR